MSAIRSSIGCIGRSECAHPSRARSSAAVLGVCLPRALLVHRAGACVSNSAPDVGLLYQKAEEWHMCVCFVCVWVLGALVFLCVCVCECWGGRRLLCSRNVYSILCACCSAKPKAVLFSPLLSVSLSHPLSIFFSLLPVLFCWCCTLFICVEQSAV